MAPLNWGLGHSTRCIPIINELLSHNCEVVIAASGHSFHLLKNEFPELKFLTVSDYKIKYSKQKRLLPFVMLLQTPLIFYTILKEHIWLKKISKTFHIDAVISDNRFGLFNKNIFSVYITHQLLIKTGNSFSEKILQRLHYFFIKKYNECWIADEKANGFAGGLSHVKNMPDNSKFIGILSRFKLTNEETKFNLLVSLSGPEPQRTIFENLITNQLKDFDKKTLLVRGLPGSDKKITSANAAIEFINHLSSEQLNKAFLQSEIIIARCGYSTIMDLITIRRNAILVPTPGQTEQEYLADYLMMKKYFYCQYQQDFSLIKILDEIKNFPFNTFDEEKHEYKNAVKELVEKVFKNNLA